MAKLIIGILIGLVLGLYLSSAASGGTEQFFRKSKQNLSVAENNASLAHPERIADVISRLCQT